MRAGFFKRGKIWWCRTDPITGKAESLGKRDWESAWLEYQVRSRRASDPTYRAPTEETETLNDWAVKFVEHKRKVKAEATASFYRKKLGHIVRIFGAGSPVNVLQPPAFDGYVAQRREEGARATTILKEIGAAKTLAKFAKRQGAYQGNPELFRPPDLVDDYEPGERFLLPEELMPLLAALTPKRAAHVALSVAVGPRYSEAFKVTRADIDTDAWTVRVAGTKTKKSKAVIPIAEPFRPLLLAALPFLPLEPWGNMVRDLERACERAKIAKVTANDLRRTHGSWLVEAGVSDSLISRVLRHVDERMVRRVYGRARPEKLGAAIAAQISSAKTLQLSPKEAPLEQESSKKDAGSEDADAGVENPRVGGSIPSPDTENRSVSREAVAPSNAEFRGVRNKNVTALDDVDFDESDFAACLAEFDERADVAALLARPLAKAIAIVPTEGEAVHG